jgi:hypothetical protein
MSRSRLLHQWFEPLEGLPGVVLTRIEVHRLRLQVCMPEHLPRARSDEVVRGCPGSCGARG